MAYRTTAVHLERITHSQVRQIAPILQGDHGLVVQCNNGKVGRAFGGAFSEPLIELISDFYNQDAGMGLRQKPVLI